MRPTYPASSRFVKRLRGRGGRPDRCRMALSQALREQPVEVVPAELVAERIERRGLVDHEELHARHGGEVPQVLAGHAVAEAGVMRAAGMDPGGGARPKVGSWAPHGAGDRELR